MRTAHLLSQDHRPPIVHIPKPEPLMAPVDAVEPFSSAELTEAREASRREIERLTKLRADALAEMELGEIADIDRAVSTEALRIEQLSARIPIALAREAEERDEHEAEQKRRKALHRQATKASGEIGKLVSEYETVARTMTAVLAKLRERECLVAEANNALPDDAAPVPLGQPHVSWNGSPDQPHRWLSRRVKLPTIEANAFIWGEAEFYGKAMIHDPQL